MEAPRPHEDLPAEQNRARGDKPRPGLLRRHPLAFVLGLFLLTLALAAGYLFWDYSRHFQSTDDAFIAARQFSIAPKVSGYITAVPVTDNQHVAAGDVIARIDDRDYRIALDQAQAQVAVAQANIQNIDAQISVQQAQISCQPGAGGAGTGRHWCSHSSRRRATRTWHRKDRARFRTPNSTRHSSVNNKRHWRARKPTWSSPNGNSSRCRRNAKVPRRASRRPRPSATRRN